MQEYVIKNDINNAISCCDSICNIRDSLLKNDILEYALISYAVTVPKNPKILTINSLRNLKNKSKPK